MNELELQGQWMQVKGLLKDKWGSITDDEFTQAEGKLEMIAGYVQAKYGHTKEAALKEVNEFITNMKNDLKKEEIQ